MITRLIRTYFEKLNESEGDINACQVVTMILGALLCCLDIR